MQLCAVCLIPFSLFTYFPVNHFSSLSSIKTPSIGTSTAEIRSLWSHPQSYVMRVPLVSSTRGYWPQYGHCASSQLPAQFLIFLIVFILFLLHIVNDNCPVLFKDNYPVVCKPINNCARGLVWVEMTIPSSDFAFDSVFFSHLTPPFTPP